MWSRNFLKTIYFMALLSIEMSVHVIHATVMMAAMTNLILCHTPSVLKRMYQIVLQQKRQHPQHARPLKRLKFRFKFYKAHGRIGRENRFHYQNPVGCRFNTCFFQKLHGIVARFHLRNRFHVYLHKDTKFADYF